MIFALVLACAAPDPSGDWVGTHAFEDGEESYNNAMNLGAGGAGDAVLYFKAELDSGGDEADVAVLVSSFDLTWLESATGVDVDFTCTDTDCTSSFAAVCTQAEESLLCEGEPAFYEDELALFRWKR